MIHFSIPFPTVIQSLLLSLPFLIIFYPIFLFLTHLIQFYFFSEVPLLPRAPHPNPNSLLSSSPPEYYPSTWSKQLKTTVMTFSNSIFTRDIYISDPKALEWILSTNSNSFPRAQSSQNVSANLIGKGLVYHFGETHRRQRRVIGKAFLPIHLKNLTPVFWSKSFELVRVLENDEQLKGKYEGKVVEVQKPIGKCTLDIIGLGGFGYSFDTLNPDLNSSNHPHGNLADSINKAVMSFRIPSNPILRFLTSPSMMFIFPFLGDTFLLPRNRLARKQRLMNEKVAGELIEQKKEQIKKESLELAKIQKGKASELKKDDAVLQGNDVLDTIIRANLAQDLKPNERLYDDELKAQISTFIFAGAETTSTLIGSLLVQLALNPQYQTRLQKELDDLLPNFNPPTQLESEYESNPTSLPSWDEINSLPFLSSLISETLRLVGPVPLLTRCSNKKQEIPLSRPLPDWLGRKDKVKSLVVGKGQNLMLGLSTVNRDEEIWGSDAGQFNPDRWLNLPQSHTDSYMPGPWNHWGFSGGVKICVGSRFANTEAKCIISAIMKKYSVEPVEKYTWRQFLVNRVCVEGREKEGPQIPLRLIERGAK